jgi:cold shock CspA family protein
MDRDAMRILSNVWYHAQCKWFNRESGFGFVTLTRTAGARAGKEVFAHYLRIRGEASSFKYLVAGEYVEVQVVDGTHGPSARCVRGIDGGPLMFEVSTRPKSRCDPVAEQGSGGRAWYVAKK